MQSVASSCAAVIPCYNEAVTITAVVRGALQHLPQVIVVDDGSSDSTSEKAAAAGARVLRMKQCSGKGAALCAGLRMAHELGYIYAVMMDGDGQHAPEDLPRFIAEVDATGASLIVGNRMGDSGQMPWLRRQVNRFMSWVLSQAAGQLLPDSQCGYRLVHLDTWIGLHTDARRFEFDSELLLAFTRAGNAIRFVPVSVIYGAEHSKISPVKDTVRWFKWLWRVRHHS